MPTVIHVSPHPDDESIAAPCTLLALKDAGWDVVNFACSLGRPADRERRGRELEAAMGIAGFKNEHPAHDVAISHGDDLGLASRTLTALLTGLVRDVDAQLIIGPHPRDDHHGHAAVAKAIRQTVWASATPLTWWMWSIWSDLRRPTLLVNCTEEQLAISQRMVEQYEGENARTNYSAMHRPVRVVNAVRGAEKVFGYGSQAARNARGISHAELLTEVRALKHRWQVGTPRVLDPHHTGTMWSKLDDWSLLSSSRLRRLYRPILMSAHVRLPRRIMVAPLPEPVAGGPPAG